jgi:ribosomal protein L21E
MVTLSMADNMPMFKPGDSVVVDHMMDDNKHDEYDGKEGEVVDYNDMGEKFAYTVEFEDGTQLQYFDVELHRA